MTTSISSSAKQRPSTSTAARSDAEAGSLFVHVALNFRNLATIGYVEVKLSVAMQDLCCFHCTYRQLLITPIVVAKHRVKHVLVSLVGISLQYLY